ncbi:MAG: hypothetical protein MUP22_15650 [Desulfobacterales bacterium]|nr:hypothetical protein [Desulfobacterales bacterium]
MKENVRKQIRLSEELLDYINSNYENSTEIYMGYGICVGMKSSTSHYLNHSPIS